MKQTKHTQMDLAAVSQGQKNTEVSYKILNGEKLNQEYPESFYIPPRPVRENIPIGTIVKLIFDAQAEEDCVERMWVTVTDKLQDHYVGQLSSSPSPYKKLQYGAEIIFRPEHIINIWEYSTDPKDLSAMLMSLEKQKLG